MERVCIIVGAAPIVKDDFMRYYHRLKEEKREVLVIAADGGYEFLRENHVDTDYIVGDFDSLGRVLEGSNVIRHPVMKDETDMLLAIKEGMKEHCTLFAIFGGMGGRPDHTFANFQHLAYLQEHGARGILFGETMHATVIRNAGLTFDESFRGLISVFALSQEAEGVCLRNLKYELEHACLKRFVPLGISNEFVGKIARIQVKRGELLVMWEKNDGQLPLVSNCK